MFDVVLGSTNIVNRVLVVVKEEARSCKDEQQKEILEHHVMTLSRGKGHTYHQFTSLHFVFCSKKHVVNDLLPVKTQEAINNSSARQDFEAGAKQVCKIRLNLSWVCFSRG